VKFRNLIAAAAIAVTPLAAQAAIFIVPAAGTGAGANNSQWQSELTLHTAAPRPVTLTLFYHQGQTRFGPEVLVLQPRQTLSIDDVVKTKFSVPSGTGAITIHATDRDAKTLAVTSRTFNVSEDGEFGQDIPSVDMLNANRAGDIVALTGPSSVEKSRFNFGVFAVETSQVRWELLRADGAVVKSVDASYGEGEHVQYNGGISGLLGSTPANNDTVHARVISGRAVFYGSTVNATGDPTFVPGVRTREDIVINFTGIDVDENGTVDIADGDGDGVLDGVLEILTTFGFPDTFRVHATGEFGETVTFEVVSTPTETALLDGNRLRVAPAGDVKGKTGEILVRATTGGSSSVLTIPVRFR
jgi:hypothetical protein